MRTYGLVVIPTALRSPTGPRRGSCCSSMLGGTAAAVAGPGSSTPSVRLEPSNCHGAGAAAACCHRCIALQPERPHRTPVPWPAPACWPAPAA